MAPPGDNSKGTTDAPGLQADIDSLLEGINATAERAEEAATDAARPGACSLEANVRELLADAPPPEPAPDPMQAIDSLDAQLAELTAELLETNKAPSAAASTPAAAGVADFEAAMAGGAEAEAPPMAQAPTPVQAPPAPAAVTPPPPPRPVEAAPVMPITPPAVVPPVSVQAVTSAESAALNEKPAEKAPGAVLRMFAAISAPVNTSSHMVRVAVTVMAIQTAVVSGCVWGWFYFRPAVTPTHGPAFNLSSDTLPRPVEPASHDEKAAGGAGDGHGAAKAEAKKPPAKKDAKKAASGGGH